MNQCITVYSNKALAFILLSMFNYTTDRDIDRPYFCSKKLGGLIQ